MRIAAAVGIFLCGLALVVVFAQARKFRHYSTMGSASAPQTFPVEGLRVYSVTLSDNAARPLREPPLGASVPGGDKLMIQYRGAEMGPVARSSAVRFNHQYSDPAYDILLIEIDANIEDINGWKLISAQTNAELEIRPIRDFEGHSRHVRLESGGGAYISAVGSTSLSYGTEGEYHLYFGKPRPIWNLSHDNILLVDGSGAIVDAISY